MENDHGLIKKEIITIYYPDIVKLKSGVPRVSVGIGGSWKC